MLTASSIWPPSRSSEFYRDPENLMLARSAAELYERCEEDRRRRAMSCDEVKMNLDQQILAQLSSQAAQLRDILAREATIIAMLQQVKSQVDRLVAQLPPEEPPMVSIMRAVPD